MTTYETRLNRRPQLQRLLTWTPGQTDIIKTVALVLMVIDHTGLLLAGNNEVMRLLGGAVFRCSVWPGDESGPTRKSASLS
jgi:hypothetical protein